MQAVQRYILSMLRIAFSIGDLNGIGPEILLRCFTDTRMFERVIPVVYASPGVLNYYKKILKEDQPAIKSIRDLNDASKGKLNVKHAWDEELRLNPGTADKFLGKYAAMSLKAAVKDVIDGKLQALVTLPINKHVIQSNDFNFNGHTEFLQAACNAPENLMTLINHKIRVALVTNHVPVAQIAEKISAEKIVRKARLLNQSLINDFGMDRPKIALLSLNPHAGDNGLIGNEEAEKIIPAVEQLNIEKVYAFGPFPADGFFGSAGYLQFDGILAMYHDQGLIPFKLSGFGNGVNFTAGLPIVRTSPDHGTAYDIAGKNQASFSSLRQAIFAACDIVNRRKESAEMRANALK